jgi:hypothetical protein
MRQQKQEDTLIYLTVGFVRGGHGLEIGRHEIADISKGAAAESEMEQGQREGQGEREARERLL